jgi:glutathione peroxidase
MSCLRVPLRAAPHRLHGSDRPLRLSRGLRTRAASLLLGLCGGTLSAGVLAAPPQPAGPQLPPAAVAGLAGTAVAGAAACPALLRHTLPRLQDEQPIDLCQYAGRVVVVVNTASRCGYTPQYKSLEALHTRYASRGLVVLGFPSSDFGGQELSSNAAIADFCENQFGVRFPMFAKSVVSTRNRSGEALNPLFAALAERSGAVPRWNFHKYLIGRDGQQVISHVSDTDPMSPRFLQDVERLLAIN